MGSRRIKYDSWPELLEAVKEYDNKGYRTEIQGFEDLHENILTVYGDFKGDK